MKHSAYFRFSITLLLLLSLLSPTAVLAGGDGKKHFKEGMKAENAEQWDKAVEEFALAVVDDPKNPEYRLHYQRSIFMASQMYMKRGTNLAEQKDYAGGYLAFRKAYAYDPTNELAQSEMERMLRLQKSLEGGENFDAKTNSSGDVKLVPTGYQKQDPRDDLVPQRLEKYQDVPFPGGVDLQYLIKELAKNLDLNVLFDVESFRQDRKIKIELKNVTPAKALDYIFLQEGLFFQKVGPRTILVATQNRRQQFQQLVLRTFYLSNADPAEVSKLISTAIPAQPGRTPTTTLVDKATNSITVRDTEENIRLIGKLINSLDKDRAEVVMDVAIYEVSKTDLLKFGNQIGNETSLTNFGGTTSGAIGNGNFGRTTTGTVTSIIPRAFGVGLVIPAISLVAFQRKDNAKLLASTQIHAFNNEDSSARIGQRVPVRTATISNGFGGGGTPQQGGNGFLGDVINYEQVGLTLKFKPIVFPNQDVQVAMEIESKDVVAGGTLNNPVFSERTIKGTARIQNNKTLLLASAASNVESNGREGLPLLGLIPILGRLFTAPTKNNRQVDIVIAVTPRVIRAPAILPEDEIERPTGSLAVPTSNSLEAMIIREEVEEQLAAARRLPTVAKVQLPDQQPDAPVYVKSNSGQAKRYSRK
ncbi:MAG: secretin N-terminal domain-containing protein [Pyrinomonadaceae bacterium]